MNDNLLTVLREYLKWLESLPADGREISRFVHPEFSQVEFPNALVKKGQTRGVSGCELGVKVAKEILSGQTYAVTNAFLGESGEQAVVEATWTGVMAKDFGPFRAGQTLTAHLGMVFEFRDGKIFRQRNYDCYEPWDK